MATATAAPSTRPPRQQRRRRPRSAQAWGWAAASCACALACILSIASLGAQAFIQPPLPAVGGGGATGAPSGRQSVVLSPVAVSMVGEAAAAAPGPAVKPSGGGKKSAGAVAGAAGGAAAATKPRPQQQQQGGRKGGGAKGGGRGLSSYARKPQHPARKYHERKGLVVQVYQEAQQEMRAGRLDKAEELFRRCLTMDRKDARSWLQLANMANRRGRQEEARSYFAQVRLRICVLWCGSIVARA